MFGGMESFAFRLKGTQIDGEQNERAAAGRRNGRTIKRRITNDGRAYLRAASCLPSTA